MIDGAAVRVLIDRFTAAQHTAFSKALARLDEPDSLRQLLVRKPGEEQERRSVPRVVPTVAMRLLAEALGAVDESLFATEESRLLRAAATAVVAETQASDEFVVSEAEIMRRRRTELDDADRQALEALEASEEADAQELIATALGCLTIAPGQIVVEEEDGTAREVTEGRELLALYAGRTDIMRACVREVWAANTLSAVEKKGFASPSDSPPSSSGSEDTAAPGTKRATTVDGADSEGSAGSVPATGAPGVSSSGLTMAWS
jgi:hypothetical protein